MQLELSNKKLRWDTIETDISISSLKQLLNWVPNNEIHFTQTLFRSQDRLVKSDALNAPWKNKISLDPMVISETN